MTNLNAEMFVGVAVGRMKFTGATTKKPGIWTRLVHWFRGESSPIEVTLTFIYSPVEDVASVD